jgi:hypothetical protein
MGTGALTVAGQQRNFTVFPNILAVAMGEPGERPEAQPHCHETIFDDINIYKWDG